VTVYGYVQPSKNKAADMKLSLQRAQTVAKQLKSISPGLKITIKAMGATINSACKAEKNKCVIVN
jgi:outer membrane protein OmpA-like peptidoglycan-associated protein